MTSTEAVLDAYREANATGDLDRLVALHAEDAVVISRGEVHRGHDEIRSHYEALAASLGDPDMEMELFDEVIAGDFIQFTYSLSAGGIEWDFAVDTIVVQDGAIVGHTVAGYEG